MARARSAYWLSAIPVPQTTISSFSPASGPIGASVTIFGNNFAGASSVSFTGAAQPSFSVDPTGTVITTSIPAGAVTGPIYVTSPTGTATSVSNFIVTAAAGAHERNVTLSLRGHLVAKGNVVVTDGYAACSQNMR